MAMQTGWEIGITALEDTTTDAGRDLLTRQMLTMADLDAYIEALAEDLADEYEWDEDNDPEPEATPAPVVTRQPLWASMLVASNGRMGSDSRLSKVDRRMRRRELDRVA